MTEAVKELREKIKRGRLGMNKGLPSGMAKLDTITSGIQRESFTLVGGSTGSGKSAMALYTAVYNAYLDYLVSKERKDDNILNIHWLIFSFELSHDELLTRIMSTKIYEDTGVVLTTQNIFGRDTIMNDQEAALVDKYLDWIDDLDELMTVIDNYCTADGVYANLKGWTERFGTYLPPDQYGRKKYVPNDPRQYLIVLIDHIGLIKQGPGRTKKQEMDLASEYLITMKNKCALSVYMVQQLNRGSQSMERRTAADGRYHGVEMADFADSSGTQNAATVVIGMFYPWREKLKTYGGYNIEKLQDRARTISVLKNRYGPADKAITTVFFGEIGLWKELPRSDQMGPNDYDRYLKI